MHPAYEHGKSRIFGRDTPHATDFLMMTYKIGITSGMAIPYFGGHELHLYMGPRRTFGKMCEHALHVELLNSLGLAALKETCRE
jgi:hypothetical protein